MSSVKFEVVHALKYLFETQKLSWMLAVKFKAETKNKKQKETN